MTTDTTKTEPSPLSDEHEAELRAADNQWDDMRAALAIDTLRARLAEVEAERDAAIVGTEGGRGDVSADA